LISRTKKGKNATERIDGIRRDNARPAARGQLGAITAKEVGRRTDPRKAARTDLQLPH